MYGLDTDEMASGTLCCFRPKKRKAKGSSARVVYEPPGGADGEVEAERVTVEAAAYGTRQDGEEGFQAQYQKEVVETEQITTTEAVQKSTILITGVIDPQTGEEISLREALDRGIVDQERGVYTDPTTGSAVPIPAAVNAGRMKVEVVANHGMTEHRQDMGLITIRTTHETRPFHVEKVIDARTDKEYTLEKAVKKGLLDQDNGVYKNTDTGEMMPIADAIDSGLVLVSFDPSDEATAEPEVVSKTYAIRSVVDPETRERVPYSEAVNSGLLDADTGAYTNKATGEVLYASDAIQRGMIKATVVRDPAAAGDAREKHQRLMAKLHAAKGKLVANTATSSYLQETRMRMQRLREDHRKRGKKYVYF